MKQSVLKLMMHAGAFAPFRMANRHRTLILTYHRFSEGEEPDKTSASAFEDHIVYLKERYRIVPLSQVAEQLERGLTPAPGTAIITIDDGYRDAYEVAFPILRKHSVPATLFVATGFADRVAWMWTDQMRYLTAQVAPARVSVEVDGHLMQLDCSDLRSQLKAAESVNARLKKLPNQIKIQTIEQIAGSLGIEMPKTPPDNFAPVTWEQLREMDACGVESGSHTVTHPILTRIDAAQLEREMRDSKSRLEQMLQREVPLFCYPNGALDAKVEQAVAAAGYRCAVSTIHGLNNGESRILALRRISAEPEMTRFVQCTSGFEQLKAWLRSAQTPKGAS